MRLVHFYWSLITREIKKVLLQRDRLASAMVRPFLWLWVIGGGMQALAGPDYTARLLPGIIAMTVLFGAMVGGLSIALDKDAGTMRVLVTAPFHPIHVLLGKTASATLTGLIHGTLLIAILLTIEASNYIMGMMFSIDAQAALPWLGHFDIHHAGIFMLALVLTSLISAALGVACGAFVRTIDGFAVLMNFVIFPVFFFSGALYPVQSMPMVARWISSLNPFSYGVDLLRHAMLRHAEFSQAFDLTALGFSLIVILSIAWLRFSKGGAAVPVSG